VGINTRIVSDGSWQATTAIKVADVVSRPAIETAGEMALQSFDGHRATECAPQKLLQLVGFRDPKVRANSWRRPRRSGTR
jgi:hypothetical protein